MPAKLYYVYILLCSDKTYYTGLTNDLKKRIIRHNSGYGAKYTRGRLPVKLVYSEKQPTYKKAIRRELEIKSWPKSKKVKLIKTNNHSNKKF